MKTYNKKDEIYEDFPIALKLGLAARVHLDDYGPFLNALETKHGAKLRLFNRAVKNFKSDTPYSVGVFVELDVGRGDTGQKLTETFVLLEHETGPEWFFLGQLLDQLRDPAATAVLSVAFRQLLVFVTKNLPKLMGPSIDHVDIRTRNKGAMRIAFSKFRVSQLECLVREFCCASHLRDCNKVCFDGQLVEVQGAD